MRGWHRHSPLLPSAVMTPTSHIFLACSTALLLLLAPLSDGVPVDEAGDGVEKLGSAVAAKAEPLQEFMEEMRHALSSQWEILQNIRYHTISIKVRLAQLEARVDHLASQLTQPGRREGGPFAGAVQEGTAPLTRPLATMAPATPKDDLGKVAAAVDRIKHFSGHANTIEGHMSYLTTTTTAAVETTTVQHPAETEEEDEDQEEGEGGPVIQVRGPANVTAVQGSQASLACRVTNLADHTVAWTRTADLSLLAVNEFVITLDQRFHASYDPVLGDYVLDIERVGTGDEGAYECQVSTEPAVAHSIWLNVDDNTLHNASSNRSPRVKEGVKKGGETYPPWAAPPASLPAHGYQPPQLESVPSDALVVEGEDVTLTCRFSGDPRPNVTWTRDGRPIPDSGKHRINSHSDLFIRGVEGSDTGRYTCSATNVHGRSDGWAGLQVRRPVNIVRAPKDRHKFVGDTVVFRCRVEVDPRLEVHLEWFKDGVVIVEDSVSSSGRYSVRPNNALVVSGLEPEDQGVYTCRATSLLDTATVSATLTIAGLDTTPPSPAPTSVPLHSCPPAYERLSPHLCVLVVTELKLSWSQAQHYCSARGGRLAWLAAGEGDELITLLQDRYGYSGDTWTLWPFWVGGRDEGGWRWAEGGAVEAWVWSPEQPRQYGEQQAPEGSCLILDGNHLYRGAALPCHLRRHFICRLPLPRQ